MYQYQPLSILELNFLAIQCVSSEVDISAEECSTASIMPLLGVNVATQGIIQANAIIKIRWTVDNVPKLLCERNRVELTIKQQTKSLLNTESSACRQSCL